MRRRAVRLLCLPLGFALCASVALPWFHLPILGQSVPAPAWNSLGLGLLLLGGLHLLRAFNAPGVVWAIRILLPWALYRWWTIEEAYRLWGKSMLASLQLRFTTINQALTTLGLDGISVFDASLWREMQPGWGWKLAGLSLFLSVLITLLDWPSRTRCPACRVKVQPEDPFCHGCGCRFPEVPGCSGCGRRPARGDKFCRSCGRAVAVVEP